MKECQSLEISINTMSQKGWKRVKEKVFWRIPNQNNRKYLKKKSMRVKNIVSLEMRMEAMRKKNQWTFQWWKRKAKNEVEQKLQIRSVQRMSLMIECPLSSKIIQVKSLWIGSLCLTQQDPLPFLKSIKKLTNPISSIPSKDSRDQLKEMEKEEDRQSNQWGGL